MKDLAPDIVRQRMVVEGTLKQTLQWLYWIWLVIVGRLADVLGMTFCFRPHL